MKPLRRVQESWSLPVRSCVPFQFCYPSRWLLLSFSPLGALELHQVDAGERAPGLPGAGLLPADPGNFGANPPCWRAPLLPVWRCRWRRRGGRGALGKPGEAAAALLAEAVGRGEPTYFAHVCFPRVFWLPGFQEINSHCWDPACCLFPFLPLSPLFRTL